MHCAVRITHSTHFRTMPHIVLHTYVAIYVYYVRSYIMYGRLQKKLTFCNCDYDCTTKYSRKISRNYNIPEIVITKRNA